MAAQDDQELTWEDPDLLVGSRIRALRKARGWTLRELAKRLDISYVYLSEMERGEKPWKLERLVQLAQIFSVPVSLLQEPSIPLDRVEAIAAILETLSVLPEEKLAAVAQLLEVMRP